MHMLFHLLIAKEGGRIKVGQGNATMNIIKEGILGMFMA